MSKLTQNEINTIEIQRKMMDAKRKSGEITRSEELLNAFEKSGRATALNHLSKIWTPEKIDAILDWQKNKRPKWKANKEIQQLLDDFLNSPPDGREHNDILTAIGQIVEENRDKLTTKPKGSGESDAQKKKKAHISKLYHMYRKKHSQEASLNLIKAKHYPKLSVKTILSYTK